VLSQGNGKDHWKARTGIRAAALAFLSVVALALAGAGTTASGEGQIVITGAETGSHLLLTSNGSEIQVNGYMTSSAPTGCRFTRARSEAVCPTGGVNSVVIEMGDSGDKVEVLDPMPVPVTAYLGDGSDKFIGNSEADTCYPQGARRNRCYGGAGNDICITGPRNSDCVGDGGDDYAKFETGSDGCWGDYAFGADAPAKDDPMTGTPGNDVCLMGPGKDGAHGGPGDDVLREGAGSGKLYGMQGDDSLYGGGSGDKLFGDSGDDHIYGGGAPDKLYGGGGRDFCDGQGGRGKSMTCETGPGH
jgi:Ca2+-binding RTX toxin-like protein